MKPSLSYVLGQPLQSLGRSQAGADKELSKQMIKSWSSFANHGDPNGDEEGDASWPVFQGPDWKYLSIDGNTGQSIRQNMRGNLCTFWAVIIPQFLPPVAAMASARHARVPDQTCRRVRQQARIYFPGYRAIHRL